MLSIGQKRPDGLRRGDRAAAVLFRLFRRVFSALGPRFTFWLFRMIVVRPYRRSSPAKVVRRNVDLAYAQSTQAERDSIVDGVTSTLPMAMVELLLQPYWYRHSERLTTHNLDADWLQPYLKNEKQAMFLIGHFSGWEPNIVTLSRHIQQAVGIYAPPKNALLEPYLREKRVAPGSTFTLYPRDRRGLQGELAQYLKDGKSLIYALDAPLPGPMLPLLGLESPTTLRPYQMVAEVGAPIIPLKCYRVPSKIEFVIEAQEPLFAKGTQPDDIVDFATRMNAVYSAWIRETPTQWYWPNGIFRPHPIWVKRENARAARQAQASSSTSQ